MPQLIIVDGGKGQLSAAIKSLEKLKLIGKISIIGIAKRLEELYYPNDPVPLYLDKKSDTLRLIQHIRNEAHRFGITFHREKRMKSIQVSGLSEIKGVGEKSIQELLKAFKSVENLKKTELEKIEKIIGKHKALIVYNYLRNINES